MKSHSLTLRQFYGSPIQIVKYISKHTGC